MTRSRMAPGITQDGNSKPSVITDVATKMTADAER